MCLLVFYMHRSPTGNLVPLDLEIEATLRRKRAERRRKLLQDRTVASILEEETHFSYSLSPDSPSSRESATQLPEAAIMADEQHQRITLEDYSSSSISQFFTSIARPEVQAHNINYLHSLIHLIQGNLFQGLPNEDPVATCPSQASEGEAHGCAFQRRKDARSRHQHLFVENVEKTKGNRSK